MKEKFIALLKQHFVVIFVTISGLIASVILANSIKYKYKSYENITVTGLASKDFESDQIVWRATFSEEGENMSEAYTALKMDADRVKQYLLKAGLKESEIEFSSVSTTKNEADILNKDGEKIGTKFTGYSLSQSVTVNSSRLDLVAGISRSITELIQEDIDIYSESPSYYYNGLSELKVDLLAEAAKDARNRAKTIASNGGGSLGAIKRCTMGVFQITGSSSNEGYSYSGAFNTTDRYKTASITVHIEYGVD
jgi:hypothetical protein